jgi:KaiC/GvpD/RAD55 family RecA-like ATPase
VLRVPDSLNFKYDPPRKVEVVSYEPENIYALEDFRAWELPEEPERIVDLGIESDERIDVRRYLKQYKVPVVKVRTQGTATMFCLKLCLFDENHSEKGRENEAAIVQAESGKLSYQCFHVSCAGRKWIEAREKISGNDSMTPFILRDLRPLVDKYLKNLTGETSIGALHSWYDVKTIAERQETMVILNEMAGKRVIAWVGRKHGVFRPIDKNPQFMLLGMPKQNSLKIELPFDLHTLVNLYPRNIIMCAGEKDAGKTAFALNTAYANRDRIHVTYFNSEMGPEELESRLVLFPDARLSEWKKITWIERASRFEDFIDPDGFNIIDFLEVGADAYAVVEDIKRVFDRLVGGLLLIVMQKRSYKEWAVGGEGTLEKARLAVNLEHRAGVGNVCRITVAKNWTGVIQHPRGYECVYKTHRGGKMEISGEWYDPDALSVLENETRKERGMPKKRKNRDFVPE